MSKIKIFLQAVLDQALVELEGKNPIIPIYTVAFYHDHESKAVSICIDTEANSQQCVMEQNKFSAKYFQEAIEEKDLAGIASWNATIERNTSLGDFIYMNLAYTSLGELKGGKLLYLTMIQVLMENQERIALFTKETEKLVFLCSGPNYEVEYKWTLMHQDD